MVRQHALMDSLSASLHGFLHQIDGDLSRPDQKFLRDGLIGLIRAGRPIVCQMARQLPNQRAGYATRAKRFDEHLVTPEFYRGARLSLERRGDASTGWSMAWKANFWARLHDGDRADACCPC